MKEEFEIEQLLEYFPEIELPVTLNQDMAMVFSRNNKPLPAAMTEAFFDTTPENVEYVPCFRVPDTYEFYAIVYWQAQLLEHKYFLRTVTTKGKIIDEILLSGEVAEKGSLTRQVATIEEDWTIYMSRGTKNEKDTLYSSKNSQVAVREILPDGQITTLNPDTI